MQSRAAPAAGSCKGPEWAKGLRRIRDDGQYFRPTHGGFQESMRGQIAVDGVGRADSSPSTPSESTA
jgi:hypothetical protein